MLAREAGTAREELVGGLVGNGGRDGRAHATPGRAVPAPDAALRQLQQTLRRRGLHRLHDTAQIRRQQLVHPQLHLEADDAVLDGQRKDPRIEEQEHERPRYERPDNRVPRRRDRGAVDGPDGVDDEDAERDDVVARNDAGVVAVRLNACVGQGCLLRTGWTRA